MAKDDSDPLSSRERALLGRYAELYGKLAKSTAGNLDKLSLSSYQAEAAQEDAEAIVAILGTNTLKLNMRQRTTACNALDLGLILAEAKKKGIELLLFKTADVEEGEQELEKLLRKISNQPDLFA